MDRHFHCPGPQIHKNMQRLILIWKGNCNIYTKPWYILKSGTVYIKKNTQLNQDQL